MRGAENHYVREFEGYSYDYDKKFKYFQQEYNELLEKKRREELIKTLFEDGFCIYSNGDIEPKPIAKTEQQMKAELTSDDIRKLIEEQIKAAFERMPLLSEKEMAEMKEQTDRNIEEMKQQRGAEKKPNK